MAKLVYGDRIGKLGHIMVGCSATIWNDSGEKILLTRRTDNGRWCLPGGRMDPGESIEEACCREALEETGLQVTVKRLLGIYTSPHCLLEYADGERCQIVAMNFEAVVIGGELRLSDETTECGYFSATEIAQLDVMEHHLERIQDTLAGYEEPLIK
ncbi:MAG: NUDIX domain-containing protein [Cyanobacteria bacterium Co-bin13]|nr:NUDIX domain-containing protein [Cyanobacteria bacterium Co-bin13]